MIEWWGPVIHEFYGSTEVRAVAACTAHEWLERPGTVGRSLAGAEIQIVDAEGNALPVGEVGEIICGHPTASDFTYQGDDGKRLSIDRAGLIANGDMGYLDAAGSLFICDRATDSIISGSATIYPAATEAALDPIPRA